MFNHLILYLLVGASAGLLAGLLGVGGGSIVVPGLATIFTHAQMPGSVVMHMAAGTSLAAMVLTTTMAVYAQQKQKNIVWPVFRKLAGGLAAGTIIGACAASFLPTEFLKILFGAFLLITGIRMLFMKKTTTSSKRQPITARTKIIAGLVIGILAGLLGIGGGAFIVPLLLRSGIDPHKSMATSSACALLLAITGTLIFMVANWHHNATLPSGSTGFVYWPAALGVAIASVIFVPLGTKFAKRLSGDSLKKFFAAFLIVISFDMLLW